MPVVAEVWLPLRSGGRGQEIHNAACALFSLFMKKLLVSLVGLLLCSMLVAQNASIPVAHSLLHEGRYLEALAMAGTIASEAEAAGDETTLLKAWYIMAEAYFQTGEEEKASDLCCKCYACIAAGKEATAPPNINLLSASLSSTAKIYKENGEYDEAVKYLRRSIRIEKVLGRTGTIATNYVVLTENLIAQGKYQEALAAIDTSKQYFTESHQRIASLQYYNSGLCFEALGDSVKAETQFRKAVDIVKAGKSDGIYAPVYLSKLASYALAQEKVDSAEVYYKRILESDMIRVLDLSNVADACLALSEIYAEKDAELSAMYAAKADSLNFHPDLKSLASKLALYNIDFPRKEREQVIRNQRLRLILVLCILVFLCVLVITLLLRNKDLKRITAMLEERNENLRIANEHKDELLEVSKAIADERVRGEVSRIASELGVDANVKLTKRESEVAALIADGLLNKEIASHLNISVRTVEFHRNAIYRKLGINNAVELMNYLNAVKKST